MHGQQTMKYLNDKAVADAIVANRKIDTNAISPAFQKAVEEALAAKAKAVVSK
jgi:SOS response regulatory protein OraA/RecX